MKPDLDADALPLVDLQGVAQRFGARAAPGPLGRMLQRLGALGDVGSEERAEAQAVDGRKHHGGGEAKEIGDGGENIEGAGGVARDARLLDHGGPLDDRGHAEAAFVDGALVAAEVGDGGGGDFGEAAVVTAEPEERVVGEAEVAEAAAEGADAAVHGDEFAVVVLGDFWQRGEGGAVGVGGFKWRMR
jgi:hypothetical protein